MLVKPGGNKIPAHCKKVSAPDLNDILPNLIYMREIYFRRTVEMLAGGGAVVNSIGNFHLIRHPEVGQVPVMFFSSFTFPYQSLFAPFCFSRFRSVRCTASPRSELECLAG